MAELRIRTARHTIRIAAPPTRVYRLIAEVSRWPQIIDPIVTVKRLGLDGPSERVRIWELIDNDVRSALSHRELNPHRLQVRFRQEDPPHPVASMGGLWLVVPKGNGSLVAIDHYYRVVDDNPVDVRWLAEAVDRNSASVLTALREAAELEGELDRLTLSTQDSMDIAGHPGDVYDFLARAQDWPQRLPHVDRLMVDEDVPDIQHVDSDIRLPNGSVHSTSMVRLCFPESSIVFKYTKPPAIMRAHTGSYSLTTLPHGVRATASHSVLLRPESRVDGPAMVRQVLRELSLATLGQAKQFAEARRPIRVGATHR